MSHFKIDKFDFFKIFVSWDFVSCTSCKLSEKTVVRDLFPELRAFHQKVSPSENPKNFSLFFVIRETKKKNIVFQRKLNSFESPLKLFMETVADLGEEKKTKECLFLSIHVKQFYTGPEMGNQQIYANFQSLIAEKGGKSLFLMIKKGLLKNR